VPGKNPIAVIKDGLDRMTDQIKAVLPSHIHAERFNRVVMTAVNNNPELVSADRRSLFNACIRAATDGLVPDGREGALVIFKDKSGKKLVQWMPMVGGLLKLIRQSGEIDSVGARIVFQKEIDDHRFKFVIEDGAEKLYHDPMLWGERGTKVLVYAYARYKESGYVEYAVLHRLDVEKRRAASRATGGNSPWATWEDEMWLKTAIRYIAKRLPLSSDILQKVESDNEPTHFDELRNAAISQLGAQPVAEIEGVEIERSIIDRVHTGFALANDKADLDDFAAMIEQEIAEDEALDEHSKKMLREEIKTLYDDRAKEFVL
jgi:recombination protein RecT